MKGSATLIYAGPAWIRQRGQDEEQRRVGNPHGGQGEENPSAQLAMMISTGETAFGAVPRGLPTSTVPKHAIV
jgi:hypothetical protein